MNSLQKIVEEPEIGHVSPTIGQAGTRMQKGSTQMVLNEDAFVSMLYLERRRAERARKRYVLMLVDVKDALAGREKSRISDKISKTLCSAMRETDVIGWYLQDSLLGVIGTEIGQATQQQVKESISTKLRGAFSQAVGADRASKIFLSFHFFPEDQKAEDLESAPDVRLYPDLERTPASRKLALGVKRAMDIAGSAFALLILSPVLLAIAIAIKLTSKGPVLFRQARLGQQGKKITMLKFRSMRTDCDSQIHKEYVTRFISGQGATEGGDQDRPIYKIQNDPRVTPVGAFLRRTSLDELPQFWNVLMGSMSLVGPRPPLEYEFKAYDAWHRRRVLEIKPGITGVWQVDGRSKTTFDDMVRLDLFYSRNWSLLLDIKILLQTPLAVLSGDGAH